MLREVVLDTETTGLNPSDGHRVIEIGCVELINHIPSGEVFHVYINPERDVPAEARAVSGLTFNFLKSYPTFSSIIDDFLNFIKQDPLIIHNAKFDVSFLNAELKRCNFDEIPFSRAIDTLSMARKKFPGSPATLDALCKRFKIDLSVREKHGALIDAQLLSKVYLEFLGGPQRSLSIDNKNHNSEIVSPDNAKIYNVKDLYPPRLPILSNEEKEQHHNFLKLLKKPLWNNIIKAP